MSDIYEFFKSITIFTSRVYLVYYKPPVLSYSEVGTYDIAFYSDLNQMSGVECFMYITNSVNLFMYLFIYLFIVIVKTVNGCKPNIDLVENSILDVCLGSGCAPVDSSNDSLSGCEYIWQKL